MNTPVKGLGRQDAWNIQGNRRVSGSPTAPRVIPGEAGERWHQAAQTWQAGIRTVICIELALGLSETEKVKRPWTGMSSDGMKEDAPEDAGVGVG